MIKGAVISQCGRYRYCLTRLWDNALQRCCWLMLNPSVADADIDDPTIRRCIGFAKDWGYGSIVVVNLFAWRATDPSELTKQPAGLVVGPENDNHILKHAKEAAVVVGGWGGNGTVLGRNNTVRSLLADCGVQIQCLGVTEGGQPKHPLYLKKTLTPMPWGESKISNVVAAQSPIDLW